MGFATLLILGVIFCNGLKSANTDIPHACQLQLECLSRGDFGTPGRRIRIPVKGSKGIPGKDGKPGKPGKMGPPGVIPKTELAWKPTPIEYQAAIQLVFSNESALSSPNSSVKLDKVELNIGFHFNKTTGAITVQRSGIYFIAITIAAKTYESASLQLMRKDEALLKVYCESKPWQSTSNHRLIKLEKSDELWFQSQKNFLYGHGYTSFTAFLQYPLPK